MKRIRRPALLFVVLATLAACQTTGGRDAYEAPLRKAGLAPAAEATTPPAEETPSHAAHAGADGTVTLDGVTYSIADLEPGSRPAGNTDEAGWWMVMDRAEREVTTAGNRVTDPALNAYISEIACRIAGDHCGDLRVYLIHRAAFNASMAPNGMMSVWTGLLLRMRNEAQLVAVLGHEFGHFLRRHTLQRMRDIIDMTNGLIFFQLAVGAAGVGPIGDIAALGVLGSIQAYGRDQEREADGYGLLFLSRQGYDPREAAKIWSALNREHEADPDRKKPDLFFASHPPSEERQRVLAELGARLQQQTGKIATGRERYLAAILPHRTGWLRDEMHLRRFASTDVLLDDLLADDPNPAELLFFKGELRRLRGEDGDDATALDFYSKALAAAGAIPAELHRSQGILLLRFGDEPGAVDAFRRYLGAAPEAGDRRFIEQMIERYSVS